MLLRKPFVNTSLPATKVPRRLFWRWWRKQSPAQQDRFATLGPLVSVLLFLAAIISAFWYLRNEEFEREQASVRRDTEISQQQIRLRLIENQEQLVRMARDVVSRSSGGKEFATQAASFGRDRPEIDAIVWVGVDRKHRSTFLANYAWLDTVGSSEEIDLDLPVRNSDSAAEKAFLQASRLRQPVYSKPFVSADGRTIIQLYVPMLERGVFVGALITQYSVENLLRFFVPPDVSQRHAISLTDDNGSLLASTVTAIPGQDIQSQHLMHEIPMSPIGNGLVLRGQGSHTSIGLISNTLFWMVVALSTLTVWMLLGTWRHMRRRLQMQNALVSETNFRRAMENSMLTGMRAMAMDGQITYVNPAFCAMTGFSESDLIGKRPPYPHWPPDRYEENTRLLQQELQGRSPSGGIEVKFMHKNGGVFDARMYVSPLIDPKGVQTGWITSMTNITEAKRIRDQLTASHERFTTVLEGFDAAVSVQAVQQQELLFANRSYRLWFGADTQGHVLLAGEDPKLAALLSESEDAVDSLSGLPTQELTDAGADVREVYVAHLNKWFDVRARYLQWTDGRLVQMLIATDITARRAAETLAAAQAEKAQVTSRLVTMGEMASSVAHELNQPLTAIANYCNGMVSRVREGSIGTDDLIAALEKTSKQAQRAGQIIHRIRAFVKRSEPQRQPTEVQSMVDNAVELAGIDLRRRHVTIQTYVAQRLPLVEVDPILIEQVLLNLLKNAAEAIDLAKLPRPRRNIEIRVLPKQTADEGSVIEFSVTDMGPGIKDEVISRLYEAFFTTKAEGLGIGLSLCRTIIESHRGRIRGQNLYNGSTVVGCCFSFTLPIENAQAVHPALPDHTNTGETP